MLPADAATLAYWRMGDDSNDYLLDSSGNGNNFTAASVTAVNPLPASGPGSDFSNPIPQNGFSNTHAVSLDGTDGGNRMIADDFMNDSQNFTVESYFDMTSSNSSRTQYIVSHYDSNDRSWGLGVARGDGGTSGLGANELFVLLNDSTGSGSSTNVGLGKTIAVNTDYYIAFSIDNSSTTDDLTFYFQDLTNGGSLETGTISTGVSALHNANTIVQVGAIGAGQNESNNFAGLVDEVRISSGILSQSELLITAVPEPSTYALMAGVVLLGFAALRRRRV